MYYLFYVFSGSFTLPSANENASSKCNTLLNQTPWYFGECHSKSTGQTLLAFANWMILFSYLIPISLFVSLEILRFLSSMSFRSDIQM